MHLKDLEKKKIREKIKESLFNDAEVVFAFVHGSFLEDGQFNDIDVAVYLDESSIQSLDKVDYEISQSIKLEKKLNIPVDVKILNDAILSFRYQSTRGHLLFSRDEARYEEFLCRTWSEYFDFKPVSEIYLKETLSG